MATLFDVVGDEPTRSITQLYAELTEYLDEGWGRAHQVWVSGEVQKLVALRSGHCYLDLIDPSASRRDAPTLKVKCWRTTWSSIRASIARAGLSVDEGAVIRIRGHVDLYAPRGELGFILTSLDLEALGLATLGEHARRRADLVRRLTDEGLLETNRAVAMPAVPLHVGLVASKDTEGYNDFVGMLEASGFSFSVVLARSTVQGARAPASLAGAIRRLVERSCDVVCLVRGGGSQSDLAAFDDEAVARAIATCPVPVLTGIGHTGDVSVADLVAHGAHRTPTACAEALAVIVREWYAEHVGMAARRVADLAGAVLDELDDGASQRRRHVATIARHRVDRAHDAVRVAASAVRRSGPRAVSRSALEVSARSSRLVPLARHRLDAAGDRLVARRALLAAYDPARLLARGWSITTDEGGRVLRSVRGLAAGTSVSTRLADGVARSTVTEVDGPV